MSIEYDLNIKVPKIAVLDPTRAATITRETILPAVDEASLLLLREIKMRTPVGATEAARGSIQAGTELVRGRSLDVRGQVTSALPYIVPLEKGSRPHWAPIAPLKLWAKRILGDEGKAYAVRAAIAKRGTRPRWMFRDGFNAARPKIERIIKKGINDWVRRMTGR